MGQTVYNRWGASVRSDHPMLKVLATICVSFVTLAISISWLRPSAPMVAHVKDEGVPLNLELTPAAFLYRNDPVSGIYITINLPLNSQPSAVSIVSSTLPYHIWFTEPGLDRIGQVVYTSSIDYVLTEYNVPGQPIDLAASSMNVWFTLPAQDQVGHLDVNSSAINVIDLPQNYIDLTGIVQDNEGRAWVAQRAADQVAVSMISSTGVITQYFIPAQGSPPGGLTIDQQGFIWVATPHTGYLWQLNPLDGSYQSSPPLGTGGWPDQLARNADGTEVWVSVVNANELARVTVTPSITATAYTIPTLDSQPGPIGIDSLDRVYFVQQSVNRIGQLIVTPTVQFTDVSLPRSDLTLTGLAVAPDDAVWSVAYFKLYQVWLPIVLRFYENFDPLVGVQMYGDLSPSGTLTSVVEANAAWIRTPVAWATIEPTNTTPDNYQWAGLDASIQAARDAHARLVLTIEDNPSWAALLEDGPVNNIADLQEFVGALVRRYPDVIDWEFYNEPDALRRFAFNGAGYAAMLQAIYPVVKAANPNAQVVMGGLALDWFTDEGGQFDRYFLRDVLTHCAGPCFDVANFHYYPFFRPRWESYGRDIIGKANYVRQQLALYGYVRPVIATETSWPSGLTWGSPGLQARGLPKLFTRGWAARLPIVIWFSLVDAEISQSGLLDSALTPRPAYYALQTWTSLLNTAHFVRTIPYTETGSPQVEGYQFDALGLSGHTRLDIYWYDCPSLASFVDVPTDCDDVAPLAITATRVAKIDMFGNRVIVDDVDDGYRDGVVHLGVLSSPIYIDYEP